MKTPKPEKTKKQLSASDKLFHKLQIKFTVLVTGVCTALIFACLAGMLIANYLSTESMIYSSLDKALSLPLDYILGENESDEINECSIIIATEAGEHTIVDYKYLTEDEFALLVDIAQSGVREYTLSGRSFRIASKDTTFLGKPAQIYAIYDFTHLHLIFVGESLIVCITLGTFIIVLGILSFLLSGRLLSPARVSLIKQKDLVANAGHELKTPITIISANLDVLRAEGEISPENEKWVENIDTQTKRMQELVTELLELSSFEASANTPVMKEFDLGELVESNCLSFEASCYEDGKTLELQCEEARVISDEQCWNKIIGVLLDNAVKYSPSGEKITVSLSVKNRQRKKMRAEFVVSNKGEIPKEELPFIFERFHKVGHKSNSFGLGLAMAKSITELLGGKITAVSENGTTSFIVRIPV